MPQGRITWIDPAAGEAGIADGPRSYPVLLADVEPAARHLGARVHFAVERSGRLERAVDVELRPGKRTARGHHQVGSLAGAHDPEQRSTTPFTRRHAEYGRHLGLHPLELVSAWGAAVAAGGLDDAVSLYTPDALVHLDGVVLGSHRHIRGRLASLPVFASGRLPTVHGSGELVVARWPAPAVNGSALEVSTRVRHGLIAEQWMGAPGPDLSTAAVETAGGALPLTTTTSGGVTPDAVEYARERLGRVLHEAHEPVLSASVKLSIAPDPARQRRALAQVNLDLDGSFIGAHVAAHDVREAVDLLVARLTDQLDHRAQRVEALRRHRPGRAEPGEWHHGDLPAARPDYFDRPIEERRLVRHKAFSPGEQTVEEAISDMDQLDDDFYLFRDLDAGDDGLVERRAGGSFRLRHLHPVTLEESHGPYKVEADDHPVPALTVDEATERLSATGDPFVFYADARTGRGSVAYRRYDGHYGLITLV